MIRAGVDEMISFLNELHDLDPKLASALVATRHPCVPAVEAHPSIQVHPGDTPTCGMLGVLNGFYGVHEDGPAQGRGPICALWNPDTGEVAVFCRADSVPRGEPEKVGAK